MLLSASRKKVRLFVDEDDHTGTFIVRDTHAACSATRETFFETGLLHARAMLRSLRTTFTLINAESTHLHAGKRFLYRRTPPVYIHVVVLIVDFTSSLID